MRFSFSKFATIVMTAVMALTTASCVEEAAIQQPEPSAPRAMARTIAPNKASLSNPSVTTDRTAKEYYLDLEQCRNAVAESMGGTGSDDLAALRRALESPADGSKIVVRYQASDRAFLRDRAVKACLAKKGYAVKL